MMKTENKKCQHRPVPDFGYSAAMSDAEDRLASGQKQGVCEWCGKYIWGYLFFTRTDFLEALDASDRREGAIKDSERRKRRQK